MRQLDGRRVVLQGTVNAAVHQLAFEPRPVIVVKLNGFHRTSFLRDAVSASELQALQRPQDVLCVLLAEDG